MSPKMPPKITLCTYGATNPNLSSFSLTDPNTNNNSHKKITKK